VRAHLGGAVLKPGDGSLGGSLGDVINDRNDVVTAAADPKIRLVRRRKHDGGK